LAADFGLSDDFKWPEEEKCPIITLKSKAVQQIDSQAGKEK
jgi:hypothetical protein